MKKFFLVGLMFGSSMLSLSTFSLLSASDVTLIPKTFNFKNVSRIPFVVSSDLGDVKITSNKDSHDAIVTFTFHHDCYFEAEKFISASIKEKQLIVSSTHSSWGKAENKNRNCHIDIEMTIPENNKVKISTGSGDVRVKGKNDTLEIDTGSGDVVIDSENSIITQVEASLGKGDFSFTGVTHKLECETGMGDQRIHFTDIIKKGSASLEAGKGDIKVLVPSKMILHSKLDAGLGTIKNEAKHGGDDSYQLGVDVGLGDITVSTLDNP